MGYGTGYIDAITSSDNLTIVNNTIASGNITISGTFTSNAGVIYPSITSNTTNTTSGTTVTIATNVPSWVKRVTVVTNGVTLSGTALIIVQLGYGSTPTYVTTGYSSVGENYSTADTTTVKSTIGYITGSISTSTTPWKILYILTNVPSTNTWIGSVSGSTANTVIFGGGVVTLSEQLTAVRLNTTNGTDTFNAGTVNLIYE